MASRDYIGIERDSRQDWVVVKRIGSARLCRRFRDAPSGLASLSTFLRDGCCRPRICLKSSGAHATRLMRHLFQIADAEVLMISAEGLALQRSWLAPTDCHPFMQRSANNADILARCAERLI